MKGAAALAGVALIAAFSAVAPFTPPPTPTRWVTDTAGFITKDTARSLDARLQRYERATGHQVIVWIGRTTGGHPLEDWATRTFNAWGIGRKNVNDGVALFVFSEDRKLRIEVGLGLENVLTSANAARIIAEISVPKLRRGDRDGAVAATVEALLKALDRTD